MVTPTNLTIWIRELAWPLIAALVCAGLVYFLLRHSLKSRLKRLNKQREDVSEQSFTEDLERYGFDPLISASTYRYLQEVQRVQFPILPGDILDQDLGLDSVDIEQTIRELSLALGRQWSPGLLQSPMVTVEDLVRLMQASPRLQSSTRVRKIKAAAA